MFNHTSIFLTCLFLFFAFTMPGQVAGQSNGVVQLKLYPRSVPKIEDSIRLLPSRAELKPGNAAVVLLRMPWEQTNFMNKIVPQLYDLNELEYDDPKVLELAPMFRGFKKQMHRAAYMESAHWHYPIGEEPAYGILLPDVQGMRIFVLRVMNLWVGEQIAKGNLDEAREGILTQIACARHVRRTPFFVCQLIGNAITKAAFGRLEILIQQEDAPNFYFALGMLPDSLGDIESIYQLEATMLEDSLPTLTHPYPAVGDPKWEKILQEFLEAMANLSQKPTTPLEGTKLHERAVTLADEELPKLTSFTNEQIQKMGAEEKQMRWILAISKLIHGQETVAASLPIPDAIEKLTKTKLQIDDFQKRLQTTVTPFGFSGFGPYIEIQFFDRQAKALQTIEAIRDHASKNDNQLPKSLSDIELMIPKDPFTDKPFVYEIVGSKAVLKTPELSESTTKNLRKGFDPSLEFEIEIVTSPKK